MTATCQSIKAALTDHLVESVEVHSVREMCIATLPMRTVDSRWVDVFIEPRAKDFYLISDGGKAVNELIMQGIKVTESVHREFGLIARAMGVSYRDEVFEMGTKFENLARAAHAVGMCSAIATHRLVEHVVSEEEVSLHEQFNGILRKWARRRASVTENVKIEGGLRQHTFDFLVSPRKGLPIAVSILNPTGGPLAAAERFGFRARDIADSTTANKWPLLAVETRSETWTPDATRIVSRFAASVIPVPTGALVSPEDVQAELSRIAA